MFVHNQTVFFAFIHLFNGLRLRYNISILKSIVSMNMKGLDLTDAYPKQQSNSNI